MKRGVTLIRTPPPTWKCRLEDASPFEWRSAAEVIRCPQHSDVVQPEAENTFRLLERSIIQIGELKCGSRSNVGPYSLPKRAEVHKRVVGELPRDQSDALLLDAIH